MSSSSVSLSTAERFTDEGISGGPVRPGSGLYTDEGISGGLLTFGQDQSSGASLGTLPTFTNDGIQGGVIGAPRGGLVNPITREDNDLPSRDEGVRGGLIDPGVLYG